MLILCTWQYFMWYMYDEVYIIIIFIFNMSLDVATDHIVIELNEPKPILLLS